MAQLRYNLDALLAGSLSWEPSHQPPDWYGDALCAQVGDYDEIFYPEMGGSTRDAKKVCAACPVRERCLEYALDNEERYGIWGGLSERARRKLERQRKAAA
jgi:WhiB family redox-sensing transcriptional regulator